jgi:hypothetical protein
MNATAVIVRYPQAGSTLSTVAACRPVVASVRTPCSNHGERVLTLTGMSTTSPLRLPAVTLTLNGRGQIFL